MKIGILLPSIYASTTRFPEMVFAPRELAILLADSLVEKGHDVVLFASSDSKTKAKLIAGSNDLFPNNLFIEKLQIAESERKKWGTFYNLKMEYEIELTERAFRYAGENLDILHVYHDNYSQYFDDLSLVPCVYTLHSPLPPKGSLEYWRFEKFKHHNYISISDNFRQSSDLNFVKTIYHGVDIHTFSYNSTSKDYFTFIGRLVPEKGVDIAIDVAKETHHKIKLAYNNDVLSTNSAYYQSEIKPRLSSNFVEDIGFTADRKRVNLYAHSKALLFPIQWEEPFGMVMVESMACGTPVIAFSRGSVPEIIEDGETGFIVNSSPDNIRGNWIIKETGYKGFVEAVKKLDSLPHEGYMNMRHNCRKLVETKFSANTMAENYEKVYQKLINRKK